MNIPKPRSSSAWVKHGPIFEPTEPWETQELNMFPSTVELTDGGLFRMWYTVIDRSQQYARLISAVAEGSPGRGWKKDLIKLCVGEPDTDAAYSIGNVPAGWCIGQIIHIQLKDTGRHRLYFWAHTDTVHRFLAAESNDGRHYRVLDPHRPRLYHMYDRAVEGPVDFMGLKAGQRESQRPADEPAAPHNLITNDATTVYQLPDGTFELYTAALFSVPSDDPRYIAHDNAKGLVRVIDRFTSDDGLHFANRARIIERDDNDPIDLQFYYLSQVFTDRGRVGLLGHYPCEAQTMEIEWCFSGDGGKTWRRDWRTAWITRGKPGVDVDSYRINAPGNLIHHDNQWWLFYTGTNYSHNGTDLHGTHKRRRIMIATIDSLFEPRWDNP